MLNKKIRNVVMAICVCLALLIIALCFIPKTEEEIDDITINQKFTMSLTFTSARSSVSKLAGDLQNNTDKDIENIKLLITVGIKFSGNNEVIEYEIDKIESGKIYNVNKTYYDKKYQSIIDLKIQYKDGSTVTLENEEYVEPSNTFENIRYVIVIILAAFLVTIVFGYLVIRLVDKKKGILQDYSADVEIEETTDEKEYELEQARIQLEQSKIELEKSKLEKMADKVCPYCDSKNSYDAKKCSSCGSPLD